MTRLSDYLIRKSSEYVKPKASQKKLFIIAIILISILVIFDSAIINVLGSIVLIWIIVDLIIIELNDTLMNTIKSKKEFLEKNNLIYVLLSDETFVSDYLFNIVGLPMGMYIMVKYLNFIIIIVLVVLLMFITAIVSIIVSSYFEKKLL